MARENVYINDRIIYLSDNFDNETVGKINAYLISLISKDNEEDNKQKDYKREPIHIYISSRGGSIYDLLGLINTIESSKTPIYTYTKGYAFSAGFALFICGHKRFIGKRDIIMYHQYAWGNSGKYQDLVDSREFQDKIHEMLNSIVLKYTKITKEQIDENTKVKKDWYMFADEAISLGCADEIY